MRKEGEKEIKNKEREKQNKAGYTATPVACGWAGAVFGHLGRSSETNKAGYTAIQSRTVGQEQ